MISAISGNVGLQTMATVTRGLALSLFSGTRICQGTRHELGTGLAVAGLLGTVVAAVAYTWYFLADASHTTKLGGHPGGSKKEHAGCKCPKRLAKGRSKVSNMQKEPQLSFALLEAPKPHTPQNTLNPEP